MNPNASKSETLKEKYASEKKNLSQECLTDNEQSVYYYKQKTCPRIWGKLNTGVLGDTRTHTEFENLELPFLMLIRITMHSLYVHSYLALKF